MRRTHAPLALVATAALACALALAGCSNPSDQERIDELEEQVAELQAQQDTGGTAQENAGAGGTQGQQAEQGAGTQDVQGGGSQGGDAGSYQDQLDAFEARVAELEATCQGATPSGDRSADYQTYLDVQGELDALEREIDGFEDARELEARDGTLAREEYRELERACDLLDDRLDDAEDTLEHALRIDD